MVYDPRAPHHERYVKNPEKIEPGLYERVVKDCLTLCRALGYDFNTVEFAVEDGVPYAIDFMNPAPDADIWSVTEVYFNWVVNAVAEMLVEYAKNGAPTLRYHRWNRFLNPEATYDLPSAAGELTREIVEGVEQATQTA